MAGSSPLDGTNFIAPDILVDFHTAQYNDDRRDDVPEVLVRRPRAVDQTSVPSSFRRDHPVAHDGRSHRSSDGLEEAKHQVDAQEVRVRDERSRLPQVVPREVVAKGVKLSQAVASDRKVQW